MEGKWHNTKEKADAYLASGGDAMKRKHKPKFKAGDELWDAYMQQRVRVVRIFSHGDNLLLMPIAKIYIQSVTAVTRKEPRR